MYNKIIKHSSKNWIIAETFEFDFNGWYDLAEETINAALELVTDKRLCIQAGGHIGVYSYILAKHFNKVISFEPDANNFYYLKENTKELDNVVIYNYGLGDDEKRVPFIRKTKNSGASHVATAWSDANVISLRKLDNLYLDYCDFICLDIEGYEYFALCGAINLINSFHPVVLVEDRQHCTRYNLSAHSVNNLLKDNGYNNIKAIHSDKIYSFSHT